MSEFASALLLSPQRCLRDIDLARLKAMDASLPVPPVHAVDVRSEVHVHYPHRHGLTVWEQHSAAQAMYVQPADRYNVFLRLKGSSRGVVQWRDGVLDIRHNAMGEAVVVPPHCAAYFRNFEPSSNLHLSFESSLLHEASRSSTAAPRLPHCFGIADSVVQQLGRLVLDYLRTAGTASQSFVENLCLAMTVRLLELLGEQSGEARGRLSDRQFVIVSEYLDAHLDGSASLGEMAALLGMTPFQFIRQFKSKVGVPPLRHVMHLRMQHARRLVEGGLMPMRDIASALGFDDPSHFSRTFRKHWGVTPRGLRARPN